MFLLSSVCFCVLLKGTGLPYIEVLTILQYLRVALELTAPPPSTANSKEQLEITHYFNFG